MSTTSRYLRPALGHRPRWGPLTRALAAAVLVAAPGPRLAGQDPGSLRLWAAQTARDQISLSWDSVPGTKEYRIYLGNPGAPGTFAQRPSTVLSASGRSGILTGMQRVANGITLVAVDASGRVLRQEAFNPVVPATSFPPPTPPTGLTAEAPSASEVTVTWDPVPGATAYFIGRAVYQSGFRALCALCSTEPRYVDRNVMAGQPHTYTIAAILPSGVSTRVISNSVTPGQTATTPPTSAGQPGSAVTTTTGTTVTETSGTTASTPTTSTPGTSAPAGGPAPPTLVTATATGPGAVRVTWQPSTSPGVTGYQIQRDHIGGLPGFVNTVAPTPPWWDDRLFPASAFASGPLPVTYHVAAITSTGMAIATSNVVMVPPPGTPTYTPPGQPAGSLPTATDTTADTVSSPAPGSDVPAGPVAPPTSVHAWASGAGDVVVSWVPSTSPDVAWYEVIREGSGDLGTSTRIIASPGRRYDDKEFYARTYPHDPWQVTYRIAALASSGKSVYANTAQITVTPPAPPCQLQYQRADNMWAAFGQPDGRLNIEWLPLGVGQNKVFVTDWGYEKRRNDGTTYYGSHLRVATNVAPGRLRLRLRYADGLATKEEWISLDPNTRKEFQADLVEVLCIG